MSEKLFIDNRRFASFLKNIQSEDFKIRCKVTDYLEKYSFTEEQLEMVVPYFTHNEWSKISSFQHSNLTERFIRSYADNLVWLSVSFWWKFDINFTREMKDKLDWRPICTHLNIDSKFVREFRDYINWHYIALFQPLKFDFVKEWKEELKFYTKDISTNERINDNTRNRILAYLVNIKYNGV